MGCRKLSYYQGEGTLGEKPKSPLRIIEKRPATPKKDIDYYPFGAPMPGRTFSTSSYRFGFNGMESDDERQLKLLRFWGQNV